MEEQIIKILHQPLKAKWYQMIESGEKPEEYREATPYWCKRFCGFNKLLFSFRNGYKDINKAGYTHVQFSLGYPKKDDASRRMTFELKGIEFREGREQRKARNTSSKYWADAPRSTGQNYGRTER